jgi:predicted amidophosphoribosyltransferase
MTGPVREMTHALKYAGWEAVADPLARRMAALALPSDVQEEAALVVPVPAAAARLRSGAARAHPWRRHANCLASGRAPG